VNDALQFERVVSVESGSETLGRAGCRREKTSGGREFETVVGECHGRQSASAYAHRLCYRKAERCSRAPALAHAVATPGGGSMRGLAVVLDTFVMFGGHRAGVIVTGRAGGAMHRTGDNRHSRAGQRRYPRREENDGQIDGKEAAHHGCESTAICSGRNTRQKPRHD
jgi:hypothetical protein